MSKDILNELKEMFQEVATLEMQARTIGNAMDNLHKRHGDNQLLEDFANELSHMRDKENLAKEHIKKLSDPITQVLFKNRYIHGLTWEEVSEVSYVSYAHAHRLHNKGLEEMSEL